MRAAGSSIPAHAGPARSGIRRLRRAADHGAPGEQAGRTPPWLISFGDMMTLFLCFFIMLVTFSAQQDAGLVAGGLGPFVAALENRGMNLPLNGTERLQAINAYRERFGLEPIVDPDQLLGAAEVAGAAEIEKIVHNALRPYAELGQPRVAQFPVGSAALDESGRRYLDMIADTLRPGRGQILVLEGHADEGEAGWHGTTAVLAAARAQAVLRHLLDEHGFTPLRVEARAWALEVRPIGSAPRAVDARLVQPIRKADS